MTDLKLRNPIVSDSGLILNWRNSKEVREMSQNQELISPEIHENWFYVRQQEVLVQPFWMVELSNQAIGYVRADLIQPKMFELSVLISSDFRSKGIGKRALELAITEIEQKYKNFGLLARVHQENEASLRLFSALGFSEINTNCKFKTLYRKFIENS